MYVCMHAYVWNDYMEEIEVQRHEGCDEEQRGEIEAECQKQNQEVEPVPARLQEKHLHTNIHHVKQYHQ